MFTASHNPARYNGIKLCLAGARPIGRDTGLTEIEAVAESCSASRAAPGAGRDHGPAGRLRRPRPVLRRRGALRPLKVVADTANGMGGLVVPLVFEGLPFELEFLYPELDGSFPNHPADPIQPENLVDLKAAVLEQGADIGLAFDGDADRVFLVDEQAEPVSGSLTTALVAASMLKKHPGSTILYNLICSHVVPEVITEIGGTPVRTRVGHSFIKQVMAETGAVFGGEHSGHYYFRDNFRADSGIITALLVLELMSESGQPLSELLAPYRRYADSGEINTEVADPAATVAPSPSTSAPGPRSTGSTGSPSTTATGGTTFGPSNTEPLLRLNVEARTPERVRATWPRC